MGKGSSPRNCFSKQFQDNYDSINWSKPDKDRELVNDCPSLYRWPDASVINGCGEDHVDDESENESCANE
jgi:hypothetical protein